MWRCYHGQPPSQATFLAVPADAGHTAVGPLGEGQQVAPRGGDPTFRRRRRGIFGAVLLGLLLLLLLQVLLLGQDDALQ